MLCRIITTGHFDAELAVLHQLNHPFLSGGWFKLAIITGGENSYLLPYSHSLLCQTIKQKKPTATFLKLKGDHTADDKTMLSLELRETVNGLPLNVQIVSCTLEELAENCRIITKEAFRLFNLKEML